MSLAVRIHGLIPCDGRALLLLTTLGQRGRPAKLPSFGAIRNTHEVRPWVLLSPPLHPDSHSGVSGEGLLAMFGSLLVKSAHAI